MKIYPLNEEKVNNDLNRFMELYNSSSLEEQRKIYSLLCFFIREFKGVKLKIKEPLGYDTYLKERSEKLKNDFEEYNDLTKNLLKRWLPNLLNSSGFHNAYLSNNKISKEEYYRLIISFFEKYFKEDIGVVKDTFDKGTILLEKKMFKKTAFMDYFYPIDEKYIKIVFNDILNEDLVITMIHELGHVIDFNHGANTEDNILGELMSTLYEVKYYEDFYQGQNDNLSLDIIHLFKKAGDPYLLFNEMFDNKDYLLNRFNRDLVKRLYAHITIMTLLNRGNDEYMKAIEILKSNTNLSPLERLKDIDITEEDLIKTAGSKILVRK